jgi:hypothetical protein
LSADEVRSIGCPVASETRLISSACCRAGSSAPPYIARSQTVMSCVVLMMPPAPRVQDSVKRLASRPTRLASAGTLVSK